MGVPSKIMYAFLTSILSSELLNSHLWFIHFVASTFSKIDSVVWKLTFIIVVHLEKHIYVFHTSYLKVDVLKT